MSSSTSRRRWRNLPCSSIIDDRRVRLSFDSSVFITAVWSAVVFSSLPLCLKPENAQLLKYGDLTSVLNWEKPGLVIHVLCCAVYQASWGLTVLSHRHFGLKSSSCTHSKTQTTITRNNFSCKIAARTYSYTSSTLLCVVPPLKSWSPHNIQTSETVGMSSPVRW